MPLGAARITLLAKSQVTAVAEVIRRKVGVSAVGNAQVDTAQSQFGGASALFDGSGDYLSMAESFNIDTGNFTVEGWFRINSIASSQVLTTIGSAATDFNHTIRVLLESDGDIQMSAYSTSTTLFTVTTSNQPVSTGTWYHYAVVRNGDNFNLYLNGTSVLSSTSSSSLYAGPVSLIGARIATGGTVGLFFNGHIDEIRISNTARYTTTFTPSTAPFVNDENTLLLLHMDGTDASTFFEDDNGVRAKVGVTAIGNAQVDTAQSKFGGASALFDGNGDYLLLSDENTFRASNPGDLTFECWVYTTSFSKIQPLFSKRQSNGGAGEWELQIQTNGTVAGVIFGADGGGNFVITSSALSLNTWYHIALVRNGSVWTLYLDGVSQATATETTTPTVSVMRPLIGTMYGFTTTRVMTGNIDEVRISDTARYTANFTPSTTPFANDANTLLLLHMDGTDASTFFEDDNGVRAPVGVSAVGNAQVDTAQSKFGGSSALFDGTGDYLVSNTPLIPDIDPFTIELWVYPTTVGTVKHLVNTASTSNGRMYFNTTTLNQFQYFIGDSSAGNLLLTSTSTFSANTWYHLAVVKNSSNNYYLYVNGTLEASDVTSVSRTIIQAQTWIGYRPSGNYFVGHMDEIRVSNTARYTANFTSPTAPFQNDDNTLLLLHMDGTDASTVFTDDNGVTPNWDYGN